MSGSQAHSGDPRGYVGQTGEKAAGKNFIHSTPTSTNRLRSNAMTGKDMLNNGTQKIGDVRIVERHGQWDVERYGDPRDAADPNDPPEWVCLQRCDTQAEADAAAASYRGLI